MAFSTAVMKTYAAKVNGRVDDSAAVASGAPDVVFGKIGPSDRAAGIDETVKQFRRFEDPDDGQAQAVLLYFHTQNSDEVEFYLQEGNATDLPSAPTLTDYYGIGALNANVTGGATSVDVLVKDGAVTQFRDGDTVVFIDHTEPDPLQQQIETAVISGAPSVASDVVTLTLSAGVGNALTAANTYVACAISYGDIQGDVVGAPTVTSASGTFDEAQVTVEAPGGVPQTWTLTFTSGTAYSLDGDDLGAGLATGNVSTTFAPTNPNTASAYFSIDPLAWGGTWLSGDTVEMETSMTGVAYHVRRKVPAGSATSSAQSISTQAELLA